MPSVIFALLRALDYYYSD